MRSASTVVASPRVVRIAGAAFALVAALGALTVANCNRVAQRAGSTALPVSAPAPRSAPDTISAPADAAGATITVRCNAPTHAINPLIYGIGVLPMHDAPDSHEWLLGATARRWGGNHTTRYNWEQGNTWNAGKDWYFTNVDYDHSTKPADQRFVDNDIEHGLFTALTLPMIGWAAKDSTSYGFPVSAYGAQQSTAPENADKGNGVDSNGVPITPGSPERTSIVLSPASIGRWVHAIRTRDAARGRRGVQMYILDNEPTLWSTTHRDVHPQAVSYDELLERTIAYATEVRRADPDAVIAGPALWGWPAYFHSGVDQSAQPTHPDQDKHDGMPLLPWWLREIATQERRSGVRLIDVVDVHFYPQGRGIGVGLAGETDSDTAARRIRATRSLWDPAYADESWIGEKMQILPRIRHWIEENHPGLGISIGEWNFGAERDMSGGLAVAEALGRFGEQGITSAFYWDYPDRDSPAFWAFRAFRNFDGHGGRFLDESISADSDDPRVSVFASRDAKTRHLVLVVLDLDPSKPVSARIDASSCGQIVDERRFAYAGGPAGFIAAVDPSSGDPSARLMLPAYSMTVLDAKLATAP